MDERDILKFCIERGLLIDSEVLNLFKEESDEESAKLILDKVQRHSNSKIITKKVIEQNRAFVLEIFSNLPGDSQRRLEKLKIKLGLSIEISKEELEENMHVDKSNLQLLETAESNPVKVASVTCQPGMKFGLKDFVKYYRGRFTELRNILQANPSLENLVSINKLSGIRQGVSVIGIVSDKRSTKNKNLILEIEDLTGTTKVLVNGSKEDLLKEAEEIALDSVIGFKCSGNRDMLFVSEIVYPDSILLERKKGPVDESVAFIGDLHIGSKNFLKEKFLKFVDYLNGKFPNTSESKKIKYLFVLGDIVTGVGNYPDQEKDLAIDDLEEHFNLAADLFGRIRKDIQIIISPGNHEGIRLMEPQPLFNEKYAWRLYDMENVILTENPVSINFGSKKGFSGFNALVYHGFSYPYYANNVPRLMKMKAMNSPEQIMIYLLKHRHLAPEKGSAQFFPSGNDVHLIREVPDIFASGHTHKCAVTYYNNILVVSCAAWESLTPYQMKFGNKPDFCKVPVFNLKTREIKILDFE